VLCLILLAVGVRHVRKRRRGNPPDISDEQQALVEQQELPSELGDGGINMGELPPRASDSSNETHASLETEQQRLIQEEQRHWQMLADTVADRGPDPASTDQRLLPILNMNEFLPRASDSSNETHARLETHEPRLTQEEQRQPQMLADTVADRGPDPASTDQRSLPPSKELPNLKQFTVRVCVRMCLCACVCVCICVCVYACMCPCVRVRMPLCMNIGVSVWLFICIFVREHVLVHVRA